jgi:hypothetical protein
LGKKAGYRKAQEQQGRAHVDRPGKVPAFEEWADGKPMIFAMLAHVVAMSAEPLYEMCELARQGENVEGGHDAPPLDEWLKLYRQRERVVGESLKVLVSAVPVHDRGARLIRSTSSTSRCWVTYVGPLRWERGFFVGCRAEQVIAALAW